MDLQSFGEYLVVKILNNAPNDREYGCIRKSWVKVKDNFDNTVVFGYPSEDGIDTRLRVIESQPLDSTWPTIFGEVVFHTDSQEDAFRIFDTKTKLKSDIQDQSKNSSKQDNTVVAATIKSIDQLKRKRGRPRKRKPSDQEALPQIETKEDKLDKELELELIEAEKLIQTYASDFDDEDPAISSTQNSSHNAKTPDTTQTLPTETRNAVEEIPVNKKIAQPRGKSGRRRRRRRVVVHSDDDSESCNDSDYTPETIHPKHPRTSEQPVSDNDQEINTNLLNDQVYSECYKFYVELNDSYQKSMSVLDSAEDYLQNVISAHEDNVAATAKRQSLLPTSQQADAVNADTFSQPQPLLQERRTSSVSEEDTRWTVRYPEPGPFLIELVPNTGVYVSKKGLNKCQTNCNSTTQFTRALLEEVFKDEALRNCSFSGVSRRKIRKNPNKTPKPGLDPKARETFFNYVLKYTLEMGWEKANPEIIMSCIKNRLQYLSRFG